jgi:2'-5' RNA ligase
MRLFFGFAPSEAERNIYHVCERLMDSDELPLRWVPAENWHVTVAFLGEVPVKSLARLGDAAEPVIQQCAPMRLNITAVEWFPSSLKPRLLTLRVEANEALTGLQAELAAALRREGFHTENRPYRPHLTLARLKGSRKRFNPPGLPHVNEFELSAEELYLFESVQGRRATSYRPVQRFEMAA